MFKKIVATCITAVIMCTTFLTAIPASAATGTDISDTFEYYGSMDGVDPSELLRAFWVTGGCLQNNKQSIDETKSAPNRGNGKSTGNYRSMKLDIKFGSTSDDTWGSCRINTHEDWGCVKDSIAKYDKSLSFSFWADVEKEMKIRVSIDINNEPFGQNVTLKPGWKQYTLKFTDLTPQTEKYGKGTKIFEVQKMSDEGKGGWKYAFFCGYKIEVFSDWQDAKENTLWLDTFAIHGDTIKERTEYKVEVGSTIYQTELDCDGSVPKNFVPDNSSSSSNNNSSSSSDKNSGTSSNKNNNTSSSNNNDSSSSSNKNSSTSSNKNNSTSSSNNNDSSSSSNKNSGTSSNKNNSTTSTGKNTSTSSVVNNTTNSSVVNNTTNSTIVNNTNDSSDFDNTSSSGEENSDSYTSDTDVSTESSDVSDDNAYNQDSNVNVDNKEQNSKLDLGLVLSIILGASLIIGNGAAFILYVVQKRKSK